MNTLFKNITAVLLDDNDTVLHDAYIGVMDGIISFISTANPPENIDRYHQIINGKHKVLMPGLINAHTHLPMTVLRGFADNVDLQTWLFKHIFPAEEKMTGEIVYNSTLLSLMESISFGTTSLGDMYFYTKDIARAVDESFIKANLSRALTKIGNEDFLERLSESNEIFKQYHKKDDGRILVDVAIHAEYTSDKDVWESATKLAHKYNTRIHTHISETEREHLECLDKYGKTPTELFDSYGVFSVPTLAAHCVHVTDSDIEILASRGAVVAHCPISNLKLNCGVARVHAMQDSDVRIAIGTDSAASNGRTDLFDEIKVSALLAGRVKPSKASRSLHSAIRSGAFAQGRETECGIIALGFDADLIVLDFDKPHLTPIHDVLSNLVYSASGKDVILTMVRGKILYYNGEFLTIDRERVLYSARKTARIFR